MLPRIQIHWIKRNFNLPDRTMAKQLGVSHASVNRCLGNWTGSSKLELINNLHTYIEEARINSKLIDPSLLLPQFDLTFKYAVFCPNRGWIVFDQSAYFWLDDKTGTLTWPTTAAHCSLGSFSKPVPRPIDHTNFVYVRDLAGSHLWEKKPVKEASFSTVVTPTLKPVYKFKPEHEWDYTYE